MNGTVCLDSSVLIRCLRGDADLQSKVGAVAQPILPVIALAELLVGARLSRKPEGERTRVEALAADCQVASPDAATAERFAEIKAALRRAGTPIPDHDIWIAALCIQHDWELAFRDKHFPLVPGLRCLPW
jgi:tRNA(fMet)-specific endonuclease VapC